MSLVIGPDGQLWIVEPDLDQITKVELNGARAVSCSPHTATWTSNSDYYILYVLLDDMTVHSIDLRPRFPGGKPRGESLSGILDTDAWRINTFQGRLRVYKIDEMNDWLPSDTLDVFQCGHDQLIVRKDGRVTGLPGGFITLEPDEALQNKLGLTLMLDGEVRVGSWRARLF
jgi:hypothetical protein